MTHPLYSASQFVYLFYLLFHVYQRHETTPPNAEHRRLFKIKNKQKI